MSEPNPYAPSTVNELPASLGLPRYGVRKGPAIAVALGSMNGTIVALPFLLIDNSAGFLAVLPGAVLGGLYFRLRSSHWPIDSTAFARRYGYAAFFLLGLPALTAMSTGLQGQGLYMTVLAFYIGLSLAIGIVVSGDRRGGVPEARLLHRQHADGRTQ